jgi:hypothetical protein
MLIKNCQKCGTKLIVIKTLVDQRSVKRIKHCTGCEASVTSVEIHSGLYETLLRSHKRIEEMGLLSTVSPVSQNAPITALVSQSAPDQWNAGLDALEAKLHSVVSPATPQPEPTAPDGPTAEDIAEAAKYGAFDT